MEKETLRRLWLNYGEAVVFEPKKLRAHLLDEQLPKKSINLLVDISRLNYFKDFMSEIKTDENAADKLIYAAMHEYALTEDAVKFGVACWVYCATGTACADSAGFRHDEEESETGWSSSKASGNLSDEDAEFVASAIRNLLQEC